MNTLTDSIHGHQRRARTIPSSDVRYDIAVPHDARRALARGWMWLGLLALITAVRARLAPPAASVKDTEPVADTAVTNTAVANTAPNPTTAATPDATQPVARSWPPICTP